MRQVIFFGILVGFAFLNPHDNLKEISISDLIKQADITLISAGLTHEESIGNISPQIPILIQLDILYERYLHLFSDSVKKWIKSEEILHKNKK